MADKRLLVLDIDGTLLSGDEPSEGLDTLRYLLAENRNQVRLVYATGRSFVSTWSLVESGILPAPDGLAASVGTEIWMPPWESPESGYPKTFSPLWSRQAVLDAARTFPALELQPPEFQSQHKVSFFIRDDFRLRPFRRVLNNREINANIVCSCNTYLDILPVPSGKLHAVEYLRDSWGIQRGSALACGDSGNDMELLSDPRFLGVLVGNATAGLRGSPNLYRAVHNFAEGVVEGTEVFGFWSAAHPVDSP